MEEAAVEGAPPSPALSSETEPEAEEAEKPLPADGHPAEGSDPELADWFKVGGKDVQKGKSVARDEDTESETEPESDNEDVRDENAEIDSLVDEMDDDWSKMSPSGTVSDGLIYSSLPTS